MPISVKLRTPAAASCAGATTETASGTRWTFSARLLAVTMMSPALAGSGAILEVGPPGCPCASWVNRASLVCDGAACWAETWVAADSDTIIAVSATVERSIFILPSHCRRSWPVFVLSTKHTEWPYQCNAVVRPERRLSERTRSRGENCKRVRHLRITGQRRMQKRPTKVGRFRSPWTAVRLSG